VNAIENLGATQNQFDSMDLSDNAVIILEGFTKLPRLKTLLLSNNRVTRIARKLEGAPPRSWRACTRVARCGHVQALTRVSACCRVHTQPGGPDPDKQQVEKPAGALPDPRRGGRHCLSRVGAYGRACGWPTSWLVRDMSV
jgi:hypothetical protein